MKVEEIQGPTPHGGARAVVAYLDSQGRLVEKTEAVEAYVVEFNESGDEIARTYGLLEKEA